MLVVAPTGSGKTLAAFLAALDRLASTPPPADPQKRCRVLYVSPLKALAVDVERNLRSPLTGIRQESVRLGLPEPEVRVGHPLRRHPARRAPLAGHPPAGHPDHHPRVAVPDAHVGRPRRADGRRDGDPGRGARGRGHQARRASRALPGAAGRAAAAARPADRPLGDGPPGRRGRALPLARSARWRSSSRRPARSSTSRSSSRSRTWASWAAPRSPTARRAGGGDSRPSGRTSRSGSPTSSRRTARRSSSPTPAASRSACATGSTRSRTSGPPASPCPKHHSPAELMGESGRGPGRAAAARPRPPRLGLQGAARPGRGGPEGGPAARRRGHLQPGAGHRHGRGRPGRPGRVAAVRGLRAAARGPRRAPGGRGLHGRRLPQVPGRPGPGGRGHRADAHRLHRVAARPRQPPGRPRPAARRDGRAGHLAGRRPAGRWSAGRRPSPRCPESAFTAVLDMLAGRYPSDAFAELRPRVVWDRVAGTVTGRPGAQRLAVTSGGTIPDRGLFGVFLAGADPKKGGGRVGELDEEMVYESRVGRRLHARHHVLAHRGHHPRPGPGLPRSRCARPAALLEGRPAGPPARTGPRGGRVPARGRLACPRRTPGCGCLAAGLDAWAADNVLVLPRRAARGLRPRPGRPDDRRGAVPRRAGRLAGRRPLPLRRPGPRPVGARARRPPLRAVRHGRPGHARRRRHRAAPARTPI